MSLYVDIQKQLGTFTLNVHFSAEKEVLALSGPSGCGKSMTLKCIAGIETPDSGTIILDGVTLFDSKRKINLPPQKRETGLLFQNYALFPNMTVFHNVLAGTHKTKNKAASLAMTQQILQSFGLSQIAHLYPHQLSGGQQQRTALARLLVSQPKILLLDEPFSALDNHLRFALEQELHQVLKDFGKTVVFVSHNREEISRLSDRLAVMNQGMIEACGPTCRLFENPVTVTGAQLTGYHNISRLSRLSPTEIQALDWGIFLSGESRMSPESSDTRADFVAVRSQSVCYGPGENEFVCEVVQELENPFSYLLLVKPLTASRHTQPISWEVEKTFWHQVRAHTLTLHIPKEALVFLKK